MKASAQRLLTKRRCLGGDLWYVPGRTCTDDVVGGQLLDQGPHVGVWVGVQLPAGNAHVEAQPGGVAAAAAVPLNVLVAILQRTHPAGVCLCVCV